MSKVIRLEASNVMRIRAVEIRPDPAAAAVVIGGKNAQGKSSVLRSIEMALGGQRAVPDRPVRDGAESGYVVLETEELVVKRTFKPDGSSSLKVTSKDGGKYGQALLDSLISPRSFDPVAFLRLKPADQVEELKRLAGLDFGDLDRRRADAFEERTLVNREVKALEGQLKGLPEPDAETPLEEVDPSGVLYRLREAEARKDKNGEVRRELDSARKEILCAQEKIAELRRQLEAAVASLKELLGKEKQLTADVAALVDPDVGAVEEELRSLHDVNAAIRDAQTWRRTSARLEEKRKASDALTGELAAIDQAKAAALTAAALPLDGLGFDGETVTFLGLPLAQASQAEQLEVCTALGLALRPELKVVLIRDGSLLDDDHLAAVIRVAERAGGQVWIEKVGTGPETSVVIEDGEVVA